MTKKNIFFVFNTPALMVDIKKYCLDELLSLGYNVHIFDASPVLLPLAHQLVTAERLCDERFIYCLCENKNQVEKVIRENFEGSIFIPMFNSYYDVKFIYQLFTKYNIRFGYINNANTELELKDICLRPKVSWKNSKLNPVHMYKAFYNRIFRKMSNYKKAEFIVLGGIENAQMYIKASECNSQTKVVTIHSWDYERFLNSKQYDNDGKPYCVYLDTYLPFHPDLVTETGLDVNETLKSELLQERDKIFEYIENKYGLEIIIAAHPRANYKDKGDIFKGRKIEYGMTAELVKGEGAKLVLTDCSNSIFFAVMAKLPVITMNIHSFDKLSYIQTVTLGFSDLVGSTVIRSPNDLDNINPFKINSDKYERLWVKYIQGGKSNGEPMWSQILEMI